MATSRAFTPKRAREIERWEAETDVAVVGFGCAGAAAAIGARGAGAAVMLIERTSAPGGGTVLSSGLLYLGGGTSLQRACGVHDTPEEMLRFLIAGCGPHADEAKLSRYCAEAAAHFDWLVSLGLEFHPHFTMDGRADVALDGRAGLVWAGENAYPFDELAVPIPRGHVPAAGRHGGTQLMGCLTAEALRLGAKARYNSELAGLVVDDAGAVVGVEIEEAGRTLTLRADRGVVLTAGGFVFNDAMLERVAPRLAGQAKAGAGSEDGRAILAALGAGAAARRLDAGHVSIGLPARLMAQSVLVNRAGLRVINEDSQRGRIGQHALFKENGEMYLVTDEDRLLSTPDTELNGLKATWTSNDLEDLEDQMELPPGSLQHTIAFYNHHAERQADPLHQKKPQWLKPLVAPFVGIDLQPRAGGPDSLGYRVATLGGLDTTPDGAVKDLAGTSIPGLFAAGRTSAGLAAWGDVPGCTLGEATLFGRLAGAVAAAGR